MPAKPLTPEQLADAQRLKEVFQQRQDADPSFTQEKLAALAGWRTQGAVSQYMNGKIPLNLESLLKFCRLLQARPAQISPTLAAHLQDIDTTIGDEDRPGFLVSSVRMRKVPVVGSSAGGVPDRMWDDAGALPGQFDEYAMLATDDQHAFLVKVVGNSMSPRYQPGDYALVEPGTDPDLEDDVLVRLSTGETLLKRLLSKRGGIRLGSWRPDEPIINLSTEEVQWMYYVAHPVPARRLKQRL